MTFGNLPGLIDRFKTLPVRGGFFVDRWPARFSGQTWQVLTGALPASAFRRMGSTRAASSHKPARSKDPSARQPGRFLISPRCLSIVGIAPTRVGDPVDKSLKPDERNHHHVFLPIVRHPPKLLCVFTKLRFQNAK